MEKYTNASAATWARTICLIVALLNSLLASFNKLSLIHISEPTRRS